MAAIEPLSGTGTRMPAAVAATSGQWIPNINMGQDYDHRYLHATIHYDALQNLALFFGRDMPVHRHAQYLQIHYIDSGEINFHIDDRLYQVQGPALFFTPPAVPHSFQTQKSATGHVLTLHQSILWQLIKKGLPQSSAASLNQGICITAQGLDSEQQKQWLLLQQLLGNVEHEWQSQHSDQGMVLDNLVGLLLIQLARLSRRQADSVTVNSDDLWLFRQFTRQVEVHLCDHWQLTEYARVIGVSESRLNQLCHRIASSSPKKIIHQRLLQEIKRMLTFTTLTGNEIGYQLGFADPAYFSRFFKAQTGMTPLEFRRGQTSK
ncbi:4-hydroxyphenylacetate catabolism regulatory protein HpaA [Gynuella sunshinyii]|uniref:AraC-type DNA-binding domain-containing protein n=1 Tax=Gynuella sunshinyii YC6258 TaxID=1445510 RepID=A0A0C5W4Z3_9GAMM|nr:4-hydroxyphenylacetate catabolism regulatory protein HpaA [Gynuella sunshinyii]AJQ97674.1 araC-type DNA-binding domain-containing protein [Gynuella sunshinyii YC6258]